VARLIGEQYRQEVADTQAGEREVIEATRQGGQDRLNAIDAAIMEERALGLEETNFYRGLWQERIKLVQQMSEEEARQRIEAADIASKHSERTAELELAQERTHFQQLRQTRHVTRDEQIQEDMELANHEYAINMANFKRQEQALDTNGKDYANKLKQIQDQEYELTQQHNDQMALLNDKAQQDQAAHLKAGLDQEREMFASNFASVLMGHQTFAQMMGSIGDQLLSKMLQQAIQDAMIADFSKEKDAANAARKMFIAGTKFPFPANIVMAPVLGAAAFAAMMAFNTGTDMVPGDPRAGDVVNAKLTPGEGVVPGGVMDGLRGVARNGGFQQKPTNHVVMHLHMSGSALDSEGIDRVFTKHADRIQQHVDNHLRRYNR
jgi:hypothetical protein